MSAAPSYANEDRAVDVQLRARLDVQGDHGRRGAAGRGSSPRPPTSTSRPSISFASNEPPIHDAESHGYETLNVAGILKYSSNIGADLIGQRLGPQRFDYWVHRFGFGSPTGVDLPGEDGGIVLHWWQYSGASMFNLPFGQGESVTPMQIATAYAAIANGGVLRPPHIVAVDRRQAGAAARRAPDHLGGHRLRAAQHADRRVRRRRHGLGRGDPGLRDGGQDRDGQHRGQRPLLRQPVRRVVRRHGPGEAPPAPRRWSSSTGPRARSTAARWPRRPSRRSSAGPCPYLGIYPALSGALPRGPRAGGAVYRRAAAASRWAPALTSAGASAASRSSHWPPTSAIHETASDSGAGVTR